MDKLDNNLKPKERILNAARVLFRTKGYAHTSLRSIASLASVDPALIIRHFGSKELLLLDAMSVHDESISKVIGADREKIGENIVRFVFCEGQDIKDIYIELVRASGSKDVTERIKTVLKTYFEEPIALLLDGNDAEVRASLIVAMMMGLMDSLWILERERLLAMNVEDAVSIYGKAIQEIVIGTS